MNREPAVTIGVVVALLSALFHWLDVPLLDSDGMEALATGLLSLAGALVVRAKVFSPNTVRQAGLQPWELQQRADDPAVAPVPPADKP